MGDFILYQPTGYSFPYEPGDCSKKQFLLLWPSEVFITFGENLPFVCTTEKNQVTYVFEITYGYLNTVNLTW